MTPRLGPAELAQALGELEVQLESARVEQRDVVLPDYPGEPRPSSVLCLSGAGCVGFGENVAFYRSDHHRFEAFVQTWLRARPSGIPCRVHEALSAQGTPYERAALEAALIDLGLRQARLSLFDLSGVREAELRFVLSLAASLEPRSLIEPLRAAANRGDLKVDVHPDWSRAVLLELAADAGIATFDFKGRASIALARELAELNQRALFEDPPLGFEDSSRPGHATRIARDASLPDAQAVAAACARGEAVNLKAPRMGGPLEVLRGLAHALSGRSEPEPGTRGQSRFPAYFGGMFEVSVGRLQARQLAALYCADAPNDLALNAATALPVGSRESSPAQVRLDSVGFGSAPRL